MISLTNYFNDIVIIETLVDQIFDIFEKDLSNNNLDEFIERVKKLIEGEL